MKMIELEKLNELSKSIHANNVKVGWWDGDADLNEKLMLVITEVAEATEGERKNLMDDHLPHRKMGEVELADALIRTLDIGGRLGLELPEPDEGGDDDYESTLDDIVFGFYAIPLVAVKHLALCVSVCNLVNEISEEKGGELPSYLNLVICIIAASVTLGYDIETAMMEKIEYNKHRADHKRENRELNGGKSF